MTTNEAQTNDETAAKLSTHEAVCAFRYVGLIDRIGRLEKIMMLTAGALITGMAGLIVTLALKGS